MKKFHILFAALCLVLTACADNQNTTQKPQPDAERIRAHLEFLADDALEGRDTGSQGYQIAANYVASQFKQLGLTPAGDGDSYFQSVPLLKSYLNQQSATAIIHHPDGDTALNFPEQFMMGGTTFGTEKDLTAELVFVGYGITSDEFNHDDYANLDVEGKIVVALFGRPDAWPSEEGAHIASSREKQRYAAERGAVGFVTLHSPKREKVRSYVSSLLFLGTPKMRWLTEDNLPANERPEIQVGATLNIDAAHILFANASTPLADIYQADLDNQPVNGFDLDVSMTLKSTSRHETVSSPNVVAILPGSDPELSGEYLMYSAHLDHVGLAKDVTTKDRINNGAMDNASGVATLLETARILKQEQGQLKRSVLFVVITGEEKGLLGSDYYAQNPTVNINDIVANINLDMPVLLYPFADVIAFGSNHSSLGQIVEVAANKADIQLGEDPMPEQALFTRSDHYMFVKQGIPSVFLMTGFNSKDPELSGQAVWMEFFKEHYHKPSDSIDLPIDYNAAKVFAEININIGREVAMQSQRPSWDPASFFARTFANKDQ